MDETPVTLTRFERVALKLLIEIGTVGSSQALGYALKNARQLLWEADRGLKFPNRPLVPTKAAEFSSATLRTRMGGPRQQPHPTLRCETCGSSFICCGIADHINPNVKIQGWCGEHCQHPYGR